MVGVTEGGFRDFPGVVPIHLIFIHQQTHQLRHAETGVRVIHLHGHFPRKLLKAVMRGAIMPHDVTQGTRHQKNTPATGEALCRNGPNQTDKARAKYFLRRSSARRRECNRHD